MTRRISDLLPVAAVVASPSATTACKPAFACDLGNLLHVLYVVAGVLAAILVVVIAFAVHAWRKAREADLT